MLSHLFLGFTLVGAEWVLYVLILLSLLSVSLMFERAWFYRQASKDLADFRAGIRRAAQDRNWEEARKAARSRVEAQRGSPADLESEMALALLNNAIDEQKTSTSVLEETALDSVARTRLAWESKLSVLATIGNNAPFVGLFGTVLGIIKAFHDLSQQAGTGAQTVTAGISEALVATAVGLMVAIPAVIAFNYFQRRVKAALAEAEALKSFLIGKLAK
jgi:biopolymer transport protein ExbB